MVQDGSPQKPCSTVMEIYNKNSIVLYVSYLIVTVTPCILVTSSFLFIQLMHNNIALKCQNLYSYFH